MKKSMLKRINLIFTISLILFIFGTTGSVMGFKQKVNPNNFTPSYTAVEPEVSTQVGRTLAIIGIIGIVMSVIYLVLMGIKMMMGSAEEKAEYKQFLLRYLIGFILISGTSTILTLVGKAMEGAFG